MGSTEGICRGIYRLRGTGAFGAQQPEAPSGKRGLSASGPGEPEKGRKERGTGKGAGRVATPPRVRLLGSGAILRESLRAQELLEQHFGVGSDVFSVTSYKNLYYDGRECDRWNRLHPAGPPRQPFVARALAEGAGPVVAALDYVSAVGLSIAPWVKEAGERGRGGEGETSPPTATRSSPPLDPPLAHVPSSYVVLGCDGFGRSEARQELRRFFEVDAENIVLAALVELAREGSFPRDKLPAAIKTLGLDPNKPNAVDV
jgi:pyruvate dehydrogenase E1 component